MVSKAYSEAATEVLAILGNTDKESVNMIPKKFIEFLKENSSKTYNPEFDTSKDIKELNLKPKTEALLAIIYLKWWANKEEKIAFNKKAKENEEKYQQALTEKYSTDNLFNNKNKIVETSKIEQVQEMALTEIKEETFIQKIMKKIKNIFRR